MTVSATGPQLALVEIEAPLRLARRALYRQGVRRGERARLLTALRSEAEAGALAGHDVSTVVGTDPAETARQLAWAERVAHRRLRLGAVLPAVTVATLLAAGALIALLAEAFDTGRTYFPSTDGQVLLLFALTGVLAAAAAVTSCYAVLSVLGDVAAGQSARTLAALLPLGVAVTCATAVSAASMFGFAARPPTFVIVGAVCAAGLVATVAVARLLAVQAVNRLPAPDV